MMGSPKKLTSIFVQPRAGGVPNDSAARGVALDAIDLRDDVAEVYWDTFEYEVDDLAEHPDVAEDLGIEDSARWIVIRSTVQALPVESA